MKELVLKVKHVNWGLMGPGDWLSTEWRVYHDLTVDIKTMYKGLPDNQKEKIVSAILTRDIYESLFENIKLCRESDIKISGCDGSAWEITQYNDGKQVWQRELGYINGIVSLEAIVEILNGLIKE